MKLRVFEDEGYVHITNRSVGRMILFEEDQDYKYFISLMSRYSKEKDITVCAYCLMDNHVHLLLHYRNNKVSEFMQRTCGMYARYYNKKYEHIGHVFQGRYDMENIFDERYFLTVNRYIIQNPEKAGICDARVYRWSSLFMYNSPGKFVDISLAADILGGIDKYYEFVTMRNDDGEKNSLKDPIETQRNLYLDNDEREDDNANVEKVTRVEEVKSEIDEFLKINFGIKNAYEVKKLDRKKRNEMIRMIKRAGYSIRTIERVTGIGRSIIQRA